MQQRFHFIITRYSECWILLVLSKLLVCEGVGRQDHIMFLTSGACNSSCSRLAIGLKWLHVPLTGIDATCTFKEVEVRRDEWSVITGWGKMDQQEIIYIWKQHWIPDSFASLCSITFLYNVLNRVTSQYENRDYESILFTLNFNHWRLSDTD